MKPEEHRQLCAVKEASRRLAQAPARQRTEALLAMSNQLSAGAETVLQANRADVQAACAENADARRVGILTLSAGDIQAMSAFLRQAAAYADPVGQLLESEYRPDGLRREKRLFPLGVIALLYEARPSVVTDGAALCLRTGNALALRCSPLCARTDQAVVSLLRQGLCDAGLPADAITLFSRDDRDLTLSLAQQDRLVDLFIVRGGYQALDAVRRAATVPVLGAGPGNCHIFIDESARPDMAEAIVLNSKVPRPLACNAAETLLVHSGWAETHLPHLAQALEAAGISLRGCPRARALCPGMEPAGEDDWAQEYFAPMLAVRLVDSLDEAIDHINRYRTPHTESIVTEDSGRAARFLAEVEANVVCHNTSTRLTDGTVFGLGGEMGISTQKYPCGGPIGIPHLMQQKYYLAGPGILR